MARREGEVSIREAAELLEVSADTVRRWARDRLANPNGPARLADVRRDLAKRIWIRRAELEDLVADDRGGEDNVYPQERQHSTAA